MPRYALNLAGICALDPSGQPHCWGADDYSQLSTPETELVGIDGYLKYYCGLDAGGRAHCWGGIEAESGFDQYNVVTEPDASFVFLTTSQAPVYGIEADGNVTRWGNADRLEIDSDVPLKELDVGGEGACAITADDTLRCWERNGEYGIVEDMPEMVTPVAVAAGVAHVCALDAAGVLQCWGANGAGQSDVPEGTYIAVAAGSSSTCGIRADGTLDCWGADFGGDEALLLEPPEGQFVSVRMAFDNACAQRVDGSIACWGSDELGQLTGANAAFADWWP